MLKELNGIKVRKKNTLDYLLTQDEIGKADLDYVVNKLNGVFTNSC